VFFYGVCKLLNPEEYRMNRRDFFSVWAGRQDLYGVQTSIDRKPVATGLEPYVPSVTEPWDAVRAGHLLRRTLMLPTWADITHALSKTPGQVVDELVDTTSDPAPPAMENNITESLEGLSLPLQNGIRSQWRSDANALRLWYANVLTNSGFSIVEKMTLFWSGHFTSEFESDLDFVIAPLLYRQNKLFRYGGLGNFADLVFNVTLDGAMLVYLGGDVNTVGKPNENYGREVMELFTMGLGNYTEGDVQEAARILTGWRVSQFSDKPNPNGNFASYFLPNTHDTNAKQFLGKTFPARDSSTNTEFIVKLEEIRRLVDTIFEVRPDAVAKFMARKIYRFFVYSRPGAEDENVIQQMADLFKSNNFEIKPVIKALLKSAHFFDNANLGAQIKTPAEYLIGISRQLGYATSIPTNMSSLDQTLFDPPNVSGWPGWHDWITTNNFPVRATIATAAINGMTEAALLTFIKQFPDYDEAGILIDNLAALLLPRPLSVARKASFIKILTHNAPEYEWKQLITANIPTAVGYMRELLTRITSMPDFQLC
jgi:hypothetical protein